MDEVRRVLLVSLIPVVPAVISYLVGRISITAYLRQFGVFVSEMELPIYDVYYISFTEVFDFEFLVLTVLILAILSLAMIGIYHKRIQVFVVVLISSAALVMLVHHAYDSGVARAEAVWERKRVHLYRLNTGDSFQNRVSECGLDARAFIVFATSTRLAVLCQNGRYANRGTVFLVDLGTGFYTERGVSWQGSS